MSLLQTYPELKEDLLEAMGSTAKFGSMFMPERFWRPWTEAHSEFFELLDDSGVSFTAIAAPRGWGKTTIDSVAYPAKEICFQNTKFVEIVSCTATVAAQNVKNLGRELVTNPLIRKMFGNLKGPTWSEGKGHLETSTGITVLARGAGQQVRGLLEGDSRPDLVIVDDLEDSEPFRIGDPTEYLRKVKEWFFSDLMNSLDRRRGTRVIYVGTILHENSLLQNLLDDPQWKSVRLELCDDSYRSNFPEYMSDEEVGKLAQAFRSRGMLDVFFREYRNVAIAPEDKIFPDELFKQFAEHYHPEQDFNVEKVIVVDPAKTVKLHSAYSAITGWGFDASRGAIYQLDTVNKKLHPNELYEEIYKMAVRLRTTTIAVEVTSLNEFITYPLNNFLSQKGYPPVVELKARQNKLERIKQLAPLYRMGAIYHNPVKSIREPLENQLSTFPRSKYLDVADCSAYMIELFALGERFFGIPENEDVGAMDDEIAALDAMEEAAEPLGAWRWAP